MQIGDLDDRSEIWFVSLLVNDDYLVMDIQLPKRTTLPVNKDCTLDLTTTRSLNKT